MGAVLNVILPFFAVIGCGYLAARRRLLPEGAIAGLNAYVWYFALPCMAFRALAMRPLAESFDGGFVLGWLAGGWAVYLVTAGLGRLLFKAPMGVALLQGQGAQLANTGYMGMPLMLALYGEGAAALAVLAMLIDLVLVQVPTMALLEVSKARGGAPLAAAAKVLKGFTRIPVVLAVAAGAVVAGLGLPVPDALAFFTELLGRTAGPVALFAIGASLAGRRVTDGLGEIGLISLGKLVLHPLFVAAGMSVTLGMDNPRAMIAVLLAALPVGGNLYVVAQNYGIYAGRISSTILISTAVGVASFSALAVALTG